MFKYTIVNLQDLQFILNRIESLDLEMSCNQELVKQICLAAPTWSPFPVADCMRLNSEYRVWCALRSELLTIIKQKGF